MRTFIYAILLTLLAQPVSANEYLKKTICADLYDDLQLALNRRNDLFQSHLDAMAEGNKDKADQMWEYRAQALQEAAHVATVINTVCKE